ncbi:lecithin retinol acyltransferase family protein [Shewanella xiamenensis]|uniref:lecithin retinol acyltransferase family protein n=1 Tax=Shewanella xiamenensis TaxID=332186 RepID=UPI00313CA744
MFGFFGQGLLENLVASFVDNVFRDTVYPIKGSIVYCELAFGHAEHSGIYVGNNRIVHLDGSGDIEIVSPKKFINRLGGFNSAISIYVSCDGESPVGSNKIAERAIDKVGSCRDYNVILDNCHQFTSGCISGNFENSESFLWMLKHTAKSEINANTWRVWHRVDGEYI